MSRLRPCLLFLALLTSVPQHAVPQSQPSSHNASASTQHKPKNDQANCNYNGSYNNSKGERVPRPENCSADPQGATAQCRDGTYSFSQSRRGTCSHHGGVAKWLLIVKDSILVITLSALFVLVACTLPPRLKTNAGGDHTALH
jgi:hypothetical protein